MNAKVNRETPLGVARLALTLGFAIILGSCASTKMTNTWIDPTAQGAGLSKIAVVSLSSDPGLRRMAEDSAASHITGTVAEPSYRYVPDADVRNQEAVKALLLARGFDGALVMRVAGVTEQIRSFPGPYYTFDAYYAWAGAAVFAPGYLETDTIVHVVSNLFSLRENKLIWSGVSRSFDPGSTKALMNDVSQTVAKSLVKDRIVL
jgi:hypothetical protein